MTDNTPKEKLQDEEIDNVAGGHLESSKKDDIILATEKVNDVAGGYLDSSKKDDI